MRIFTYLIMATSTPAITIRLWSFMGFLCCFVPHVLWAQGDCIGNMINETWPCDNVELLAQVPNVMTGGLAANDLWGWTDSTDGREYVLLGKRDGTWFIEVTNPKQPRVVGKLSTIGLANSLWRDVKVLEDKMLVVSEVINSRLQVFDLTRLRNVADPPILFDADARYTGLGRAHNIVINEDTGFAYVVGTNRGDAYNGGAHFIDINDPKNPTAAGGYADNGYSHDAQVITYNGPDADYSGKEIYIGANESQVIVADVTDKANPTGISTVNYPNVSYTHQGWFTDNQRYFILGDETDEINFGFQSRTLIFDVSDLDNPVLHDTYLGTTSAIDHNGYVKGDAYFLANYTAGLRVLDISDIAGKSIVETGFFDTYTNSDNPRFDGVWSVYPYFESGKIIVSDINLGLFVLKESQ